MNVIKYLKTETRWIPVPGKTPVNNSIWQSQLILCFQNTLHVPYSFVLRFLCQSANKKVPLNIGKNVKINVSTRDDD